MDYRHNYWISDCFTQEYVRYMKFAFKSMDTAERGHMPTIAVSIAIWITTTSIRYQWRCSPVDVCVGSAFTGEYLHW